MMSSEPSKAAKFARLRQKAEETLLTRAGEPDPAALDEVRRLMHELEVYEVELEMQNAELREAQQELVISRDRYADLYDFAPVGYVTLDEDGLIREINLTGAKMLDAPRSFLFGAPLVGFIGGPDKNVFLKRIRACLTDAQRASFEVMLDRRKLPPLPVQIQVIPAEDAHDRRRVQCRMAITDISELHKAKEAAEAASRAKSQFLAHVSHELRTPMNAVLGMTELALGETLSAEVRDHLETAQQSANSLLTLLNELLDLSRIEAGKFVLESVPFALCDLVEETAKALRVQVADKRLEVTCDLAQDLPGQVLGDPLRLRQVLTNLIGNAIKFTEQGEVHVRATLEHRSREETLVRFAVQDTGIGIAAEDQQRIFDAFSQADSSTTRRHAGSGLGLTIAASLVSMMGGQLAVESEPGCGSTFSFALRLQVPDEKKGGAVGDAALLDRLRGLSALVVDDSATNRLILEHMLHNWGVRVELAADGRIALEKAREAAAAGQPFHLMVLDAMMPGMDGIALAEAIQKDANLAGTALMMLSSVDRQTLPKEPQRVGIVVCLEKPISQAELLRAVGNALSDRDYVVAASTEEKSPAALDGRTQFPRRVLLAEDTAANRKLVLRILEKRGHQVEIAENGRVALERIENGDFDLVLMDVQMPIMDGLEATAKIRTLHDAHKSRVPIVAMTAYAMRQDQQRCLDAGMDAYLSKPIDKRTLIEMVEFMARQRAH